MTAPVFTWNVAYGTAMDIKPRVLSVKYGDGYEQRTADGINYELENWSVTVHSTGESGGVSAVESFLRTQAGVTAFQWATPHGRTALFVCRNWRREVLGPGTSRITGTFEEVLG